MCPCAGRNCSGTCRCSCHRSNGAVIERAFGIRPFVAPTLALPARDTCRGRHCNGHHEKRSR